MLDIRNGNRFAFFDRQRIDVKESIKKLVDRISDGEHMTVDILRSHLKEEWGTDLLEDSFKESLLLMLSQASSLKSVEGLIKLSIFATEKNVISDITMTLFEDLFECIPLSGLGSSWSHHPLLSVIPKHPSRRIEVRNVF